MAPKRSGSITRVAPVGPQIIGLILERIGAEHNTVQADEHVRTRNNFALILNLEAERAATSHPLNVERLPSRAWLVEQQSIRSGVVNLEKGLRVLDCCGKAMLQHPRADSTCSTGAEKQTLSCYCEERRARSPCCRWQAPLRSDRVVRATAGGSPASRRVLGYSIAREVPRRNVLFLPQRRTSAPERWPPRGSTSREESAFAAVGEPL
jgi:hypothetical protein